MALGVVGTSNNICTDTLDGWTDEETTALKKGIREHGTRWSEISKLVGPNKSHYQCKEFYFSFRKKLGLDLLVQEYKKVKFITYTKIKLKNLIYAIYSFRQMAVNKNLL